jgi:two-component system, sensor histidine kinase and response regulator
MNDNLKLNLSGDPPADILVIDDDPVSRKIVEGFLTRTGFNLFTAVSGEEGLKLLEDYSIDIVLLDVIMPGLGGFETCRRLRRQDKFNHIPVIFMSSASDTDSIVKGFSFGGVDYVAKPFNKEEVIARVKSHLRIIRQEQQLKKLNADKNKFFSIIAHDLRGPVTGFLGSLMSLRYAAEAGKTDDLIKYLDTVDSSARETYSLLENLLEWSALQMESFRPIMERIDTADAVRHVFNELANKASSKNIKLEYQENGKVYTFTDKTVLLISLRNLVTNAIKFSFPGQSISVNALKQDNKSVINIRDEGVGMDDETLSNLFRIDKTTKRKGTQREKGSGLGLILVKELVTVAGGDVSVSSRKNNGSVFSLLFYEGERE